ncbi:MAG: ABC-F family ATP-binding cassette domain-containing protein [Deinococcales bacterium]|nr:ABC-F family ATP-binding cassette domain-containing protein [Deinococcales bacterium]
MLLAALHSVDKYYGGQTVLKGASLELFSGSNTAIIGRNGAGKTTILRLLSGTEPVDGGSVFVREETSCGLLTQEDGEVKNKTVQELVEEAFIPLHDLGAQLAELEKAGLDDHKRYSTWEVIHERFERRGGYQIRARQEAVLHAFGFKGRVHERASSLSGGELTRLGLARLLMQQPEILFLDEPTNHLDIDMRAWLGSYLRQYPGSALVVSHDREFLDRICDRTAEVIWGGIRVGKGNPTTCRELWRKQAQIQEATRKKQEREQARLSESSTRMRRWARQNEKLHRRARAMERRLERFEETMIKEVEGPLPKTSFTFPSTPSGNMVIQAEHLTKSYKNTLFDDFSVVVRKRERIALVGPNGAGKSTLLQMLLGKVSSDDLKGVVRFGARVRVGFYEQTLQGADPKATLITELIRLVGDVEAHNLLGRFMFPYESQYKLMSNLSGGERARFGLLKLTLSKANLLIMDEPTNHLDFEMIEALEEALRDFDGTILIVSHDTRFVQRVSNKIWEMREGRLRVFDGDWDYYQDLRGRESKEPSADPHEAALRTSSPKNRTKKSKWQLEQEVSHLEKQIDYFEKTLEDFDQVLAQPDKISVERIAELGIEYEDVQAALLAAIEQWEKSSSELAGLSQN